jgi:hypothetical protein
MAGNFFGRRVSEGEEVFMPTLAFSIPVLAGKTDAFRSAQDRFIGQRRHEFEASRERLGISAEQGFLQHTPHGDVAVVVFEVEDPMRMLSTAASSAASIDVDFRRYLYEVFGLDLASAPATAPSEQVFHWRR